MSKPGPDPFTIDQAAAEGWYRPNRAGGLCECGCGQPARLAPYSERRRGWVKGAPVRFLPGHWLRMRSASGVAA